MSGTPNASAWKHLAFFVAGFAFDAFMIRRIDDVKVLVQQGLYLVACGILLGTIVVRRERAHRWTEPALHFMLGTLLNAYALFYVKSGSGVAVVLFLAVISALLLVNELPGIRRFGPVVLYGLYGFSLTSYLAYLYPMLFGRIRPWMFVLAVATSAVPLTLVGYFHTRAGDRPQVVRHALIPSLAVQGLLLTLYFLGLIPPVPLSLMEIGIYHDVSRQPDGSYRVSYLSPSWYKVWIRDDIVFRAQQGDRIYTFFRVFAPRGFRDDVRVAWLYRPAGGGWTSAGDLPIAVTGGREGGYRGFSYKQAWRPGDWRIVVRSIDGREIGRRTFVVRADERSSDERAITSEQR